MKCLTHKASFRLLLAALPLSRETQKALSVFTDIKNTPSSMGMFIKAEFDSMRKYWDIVTGSYYRNSYISEMRASRIQLHHEKNILLEWDADVNRIRKVAISASVHIYNA